MTIHTLGISHSLVITSIGYIVHPTYIAFLKCDKTGLTNPTLAGHTLHIPDIQIILDTNMWLNGYDNDILIYIAPFPKGIQSRAICSR